MWKEKPLPQHSEDFLVSDKWRQTRWVMSVIPALESLGAKKSTENTRPAFRLNSLGILFLKSDLTLWKIKWCKTSIPGGFSVILLICSGLKKLVGGGRARSQWWRWSLQGQQWLPRLRAVMSFPPPPPPLDSDNGYKDCYHLWQWYQGTVCMNVMIFNKNLTFYTEASSSFLDLIILGVFLIEKGEVGELHVSKLTLNIMGHVNCL